ncbi:TIGR01777 family oxidoreductase [Alteribacillus sp. YIM 98480]|uniref:TIGR01777 family oxidoreductase n=1 Tax=Alteribacillus sp. YIM 98480 TaxID=2606599 RepID=UPI00131E3C57|nr:TIGR01777 family oxidoreductase [Alteribacillus sp. YIM 98480]
MNKKIVLPGGSGFLGQSLALFLLNKGYDVTILTRGHSRVENSIRYVHWDGRTMGEWAKELDGCYAVVNFTGKSVNCIYTEENKKEIIRSRYYSVRILQKAIQTCEQPPQAFVQAGSLAIFGNTRDVCTENSPHGEGFSVKVCQLWEKAFFAASLPHTRQAMLRIGFALGRDGGALEPLKKLVKYNLGGKVGPGNQYISWLHIDDLNSMFLKAIEDKSMGGIYNATGPQPVTNKEFMKTLRKVLNKGWAPPAPTPLVWAGAYVVMGTEPSLALTGRNALPQKLIDEGFTFQYNNLKTALSDLLSG